MTTGNGWTPYLGPALPPEMTAAMAARGRERSASTRRTDAELHTRAKLALNRARKPLTATDLAERARITPGTALAILRVQEHAGDLTRLHRAGSPAPYHDRYATPAVLPTLATLERTTPMPEPAPAPGPAARAANSSRTARPGTAARPAAGPMLAAALAYAERGWHVFPLRPGDKRPAVTGWQDRATTDPARITRCWTHVPPGGVPWGIGIACGPSALIVLDLDVPKPGQVPPPEWAGLPGVHDGADVLAVLADRAGQPYPCGDTHTVTTASGGTHLYYAAPTGAGEPLRNTAGALGWLLDTRAAGGYVVAPPTTITREDGIPGTYTIVVHAPVAPLPSWLAGALTPRPLPAQKPVHVALAATGDARRDAYLAAAVSKQLASITDAATAGDGRKQALYRSAVALGQLVAGGELGAGQAAGWLQAAAGAAGLDPGPSARTIRSGFTAGANRPRTLTTTRTSASQAGQTSIGAAA